MKMLTLVVFIALTVVSVFADSGDVILPPPSGSSGTPVGIVWIQGAEIPASQYTPLATNTQSAFAALGLRAWIYIPEEVLSTPNPLTIGGAIARSITGMQQQGLPTSAPLFGAAHSLGTEMIQIYINGNTSQPFQAVILMGGTIARTANRTWTLPVMQIAAEVDGLCYITRMVQAYYYQVEQRGGLSNNQAVQTYPVGVIAGASHMQFASGAPPLLVKLRDLKPFVTEDQAHSQIAGVIAAYVRLQVASSDATSQALIAQAGDTITTWVSQSYTSHWSPMLEAMDLEGSPYIGRGPACNCNPTTCGVAYPCPSPQSQSCTTPSCIVPPYGSDPFGMNQFEVCTQAEAGPDCRIGSKWGEFAQQWIATSPTLWPDVQFNVTSGFHPVEQTSPWSNLPYIYNNCTKPDASCLLQVHTVNENTYEWDPLDTGFGSQAATGIKAKMVSRQRACEHILPKTPTRNVTCDWNATDGWDKNLCAAFNNQSLTWALQKATSDAVFRYNSLGQKMTFGADINAPGPFWTSGQLEWTYNNDTNTVSIASPAMSIPTKYWITSAEGFHYCYLVSPFAALEWVILDSLRNRDGLSS